jgi:alpha-ketoglutarate-dependent taurine dioxygenase
MNTLLLTSLDTNMKYEQTQFGFTVTECDYSSADAEQVKKLVGDGRFVVIKNKEALPARTLVEFYRAIGNVVKQDVDSVDGCVDGYGELVKAGKGRLFSGKEDGELEWHCAGMNRAVSDDIVAMYMAIHTSSGGDTFFSDSQTAFTDLDPITQEQCRQIKGKYVTYSLKQSIENMHYKEVFHDKEMLLAFKDIDGNPSFDSQVNRKDLVTVHPITGVAGLYFPWSVIRGFTGMPVTEQKLLYHKLKAHTLQDKYIYRHHWDQYDIVLSDQHHSLHRRESYDGNRELWRAGIVLQSKASSIEEWSCMSSRTE